jgi:peptidoglycan hydrolase CwlO-like protein
MTPETYIAIVSIVISAAVAVFSVKKSRAEVNNLDAATFKQYQASLKEAHENYDTLNEEIHLLTEKDREHRKCIRQLECHVRSLTGQVIRCGKTPITLEQALARNCNGLEDASLDIPTEQLPKKEA